MENQTAIAKKPAKDALIQVDFLNGSQLQLIGGSAQPAPLQNETMVGNTDLGCPNGHHHGDENSKPSDGNRSRPEQPRPILNQHQGSHRDDDKDRQRSISHSFPQPMETREVDQRLVGCKAFVDVAHGHGTREQASRFRTTLSRASVTIARGWIAPSASFAQLCAWPADRWKRLDRPIKTYRHRPSKRRPQLGRPG